MSSWSSFLKVAGILLWITAALMLIIPGIFFPVGLRPYSELPGSGLEYVTGLVFALALVFAEGYGLYHRKSWALYLWFLTIPGALFLSLAFTYGAFDSGSGSEAGANLWLIWLLILSPTIISLTASILLAIAYRKTKPVSAQSL